MGTIATIISVFAQGLGTAIGGWPVAAANILIGFGLSFVKKGDDLGEKQLQELKQINQNLEGMRQDLGLLDSDLNGIEETLEQILGQEKLNNWLSKQNTIADALAHIETDFQNYQAFMSPQANGQLPKVPPTDLQALANRAYLYAGLNDEEAVTKIQQAVVGSGAGDGLLDLYTTLLIDFLNKKAPKDLSSSDLNYVANGLVSYFARLLAYQVNGMAVVIECKCMNAVDPAIMQEDWKGFVESVNVQSGILLDTLWSLITAWRNEVQANGPTGGGEQFGVTAWLFGGAPADLYANNDLLAFLPGGPVSGSTENVWLNQNYNSVLTAPEQDYLTRAENLIAACNLSDAKARRVVIHVLFYIGIGGNDPASAAFSQSITLRNTSTKGKVDVRKAEVFRFSPVVNTYWIRHTFDLQADGPYQMADVRASMPHWPGYYKNFVFQSDADLKLTATVNPENPVGIIRFAPYVQAV